MAATMAREAQFASLDGAVAQEHEEFEYAPDPDAIARRSVSIFSRRGTETPEPKPPFIAQAAMAPRRMSERQKSWIGRRRSVSTKAKAESPQKPKGTILHAVPPSNTIKMTALEEEMATSPNEEILSAVSEHLQTPLALAARSHPPSPIHQHASFWNKSTSSLAHRTKSEKKKDTNNKIGMWVNGVVHWDDEIRHETIAHWQEAAIVEETGFTPLQPVSFDPLVSGFSTRPNLSIVIPDGAPRVNNDMTLSTVVQSMPQRMVVPVAPASMVSKFNLNPKITISPVEPTPSVFANELITPVEDVAAESSSDNERCKASRTSSSSSLTDGADGGSSNYSKRSSATSVDLLPIAIPERSKKRLSGLTLTSPSPIPQIEAEEEDVDLNKPLPPSPIPSPQRLPPAPPTLSLLDPASKASRAPRRRSLQYASGRGEIRRSVAPKRSTCSLSQLDLVDREFMRTSPYAQSASMSEPESPTLSQAEQDVHTRLSDMSKESQAGTPPGTAHRSNSVRSVMQPPERAPTLPKRSRKREWRASGISKPVALPTRRLSDSGLRQPAKDDLDELVSHHIRRSTSVTVATAGYSPAHPASQPSTETEIATTTPVPLPRIVIDDGLIVVHGPIILSETGEPMPPHAVAAASAEEVLLHILAALTSFSDLQNTATINKGMYRVYKENEMHLLRTVAWNQSPAAWEFREWSPPERNEVVSSKASSQLEHTAKSYTRCYARDVEVLGALKKLILQQCQTIVRRETAFALASPLHPSAQRLDDAFWRIWCFCKIFGCGKNREDDVTGQLDWLKGGLLANNQGCVATVNTNLEFDMSSVLLNAPDHFAKGNANGLTAQQLYDMTELWTCLSALLSGYQGRVEQAREAGVFDDCDVEEGDVEREEQALEEWIFYLLTLGPETILDLAVHASDPSPTGFTLAKMHGWTQWSPSQYGGSRSTFLKEPVARLYEERVAVAAQRLQNPEELEKKEMSRKRVATLAAEIKLNRQTSTYKRSPYIDMHSERPMSVLSRRSSTASSRSHTRYSSPVACSPVAINFSTPRQPATPTSGAWSPRKISPIIEDRVETFNRLSLQNFAPGIADDTGELAIKRIVDMGFTPAQAREALRTTDMGDGIRVDRAVDLLLRQQFHPKRG